MAARFAQTPAQCRIVHHATDCGCQRRSIARGHQQPVDPVLNHLRYSGDTRRDHRQLHGHGFQQYVGYSIPIPVTRDLAGQREHGRATIQINQFILGHFASQLDGVVQPMATDKAREPVVLLAITHNLAAHDLSGIA